MYFLNIANTLKKTSGNQIRNFIFENYYKQIGFFKENSCYSMKQKKKNLELLATSLTEKIPNPSNAKEHYQSFIRKKNTNNYSATKIF